MTSSGDTTAYDVLLSHGWREALPGRGGVLRQFEKSTGKHPLVLEERGGKAWLWIEGEDARDTAPKHLRLDNRVLGLEYGADLREVLELVVALEPKLDGKGFFDAYTALQQACDVTIVMHDQFVRSYQTQLPPPGDAIYKFFSQVVESVRRDPSKRSYEATLAELGPPSAWMGLWLGFDGAPAPTVDYGMQWFQIPDPRVPKAQVKHLLWTYQGRRPVPNVAQPKAEVVEAVASIARLGFDLAEWEEKAKAVAATVGCSWEELLGAMVYVGGRPFACDPFLWVMRMQIAAALVLAALDQGWEGSTRKRVLFDLALGPVDWSVTAAILALSCIARRDDGARADIVRLFTFLRDQTPRSGATCYAAPLAITWIGMGNLSKDAKEEIAAYGRTAWAGGGQDAEVHNGMDVAGYAEFCIRREALPPGTGQAELTKLWEEYAWEGGDEDEWKAALDRSPALGRELLVERKLALHRLRMRATDPAGEEGRRLLLQDHRTVTDVQAERARAQAAQAAMAAGEGGDPDPVLFPGQPVARLSDYVALMKAMQTGNLAGALARFRLDMMSYAQVMTDWGQKLAADPSLNIKLGQLMIR